MLCCTANMYAQIEVPDTKQTEEAQNRATSTPEYTIPEISYTGTPQKYVIGGIAVEGAKGTEDYVIIGLSGLSNGQQITVPGQEITDALKRYWKNGLFSDVKIGRAHV